MGNLWRGKHHPPSAQRCEALLMDSYLRPTNDRCHCHSHVLLRKRRLCHKHAQIFALNILMKAGEVKTLPRSPIGPSRPRFHNEDEIPA